MNAIITSNPKMKNQRLFCWLPVHIISLMLWFTGTCVAQESKLDTLVNRFLSGQYDSGFIAFQRQILYPQIRTAAVDQSSNGTNKQTRFAQPFYCFVGWNSTNFIIGFSESLQITNTAGLGDASRLYGFDGSSYWQLLQEASHNYIDSKENAGILPPSDSASVLTVIPAKEAASSDTHVENSTLAVINELAAECRRVVQCGFSFPLVAIPDTIGSNGISVTGAGSRQQNVRVVGNLKHPEEFYYEPSTNVVMRFHVRFDYVSESMVIDRLSRNGPRPVTSVRYQILAIKPWDIPSTARPFSWETYRSDAGRIIGEVVKNGATLNAEVGSNGQIQPGKIIEPAKPLPGYAHSVVWVYAALAVTTVFFLTLIFVRKNKT